MLPPSSGGTLVQVVELQRPPEPNSVTLKAEAARSSEKSEQTYCCTRCNNPEGHKQKTAMTSIKCLDVAKLSSPL